MTIDKAIKIKEDYFEKYRVHMLSNEREADRMSIEALKRIDNQRSTHGWNPQTLLPGETKD